MDIRRDIESRINQSGPQTEKLEAQWASLREYYRLRARVEDLQAKLRQVIADPEELNQLKRELEVAVVALNFENVRLSLEGDSRESFLIEESKQRRQRLVDEIFAEAKALAIERGYDMVVSDSLPSDGSLTALFVTKRADDVTDELLARLNKQYASTTNQGLHPKAEKKP